MNEFQEWCKEISEVIVAAANGEEIQVSYDGKTWANKIGLNFDSGYKYRVKPRTIKIGDFDVPEPMRVEPKIGSVVYYANPYPSNSALKFYWGGSRDEKLLLARGMIHADSFGAEIHAKAIVSFTEMK